VNHKQIKRVIERVLRNLGYDSQDAIEMVFLTGLVESNYDYLEQLGSGPAKSFFQIEPNTCKDIIDNYLAYRTTPRQKVTATAKLYEGWYRASTEELGFLLETNIAFAVCMCRLHYRRVPKPLPKKGDSKSFGEYWKKWFNTNLGAGTIEKFLDAESRRKDE
jgi:hypothetical protein